MWIVPSSIRSNFAQASGCSLSALSLDLKRWASECAPLLTSSGKHSPARSWETAASRKPWAQRLYSRALPNSMDGRFAGWWTSLLLASRASRTALPENARATPTGAASAKAMDLSSTPSASSKKSSLPWCSSKTSQPGLPLGISGSDQSASDFQRWVIESKDRSSSLRAMLARATSGKEYSSWPTARAEDSESAGNHPGATDSLTGMLRNCPTPDSHANERTNRPPSARAAVRPTIARAAKNWKTPHGMAGIDHTGKVGGGGEFAKEVEAWMTPNVPNGGRKLAPGLVESKGTGPDGIKRQVGLENQVELWATPRTITGGAES